MSLLSRQWGEVGGHGIVLRVEGEEQRRQILARVGQRLAVHRAKLPEIEGYDQDAIESSDRPVLTGDGWNGKEDVLRRTCVRRVVMKGEAGRCVAAGDV